MGPVCGCPFSWRLAHRRVRADNVRSVLKQRPFHKHPITRQPPDLPQSQFHNRTGQPLTRSKPGVSTYMKMIQKP
jgi:hypothetical protein